MKAALPSATLDALAPEWRATAAAVLGGDRRALGRLISRVERGDPDIIPLLQWLYRQGGNTRVIGVTGPPGAGKSTLVNQLLRGWRRQGLSVAVLAVDPSSPYSGGAILGDRVRMAGHSSDDGTFIRSMAARGRLGGVSHATADVLTLLQAMPWDRILIETVGVGQSETEIMRHAAVVLVLQTPMAGDEVQAVKAGVLEIADIYVVNKGDLPGADQAVRQIEDMLNLGRGAAPPPAWRAPVLKVESLSGAGIAALDEQIELCFAHLRTDAAQARQREIERTRYRVMELMREALERRLLASADPALDALIEQVALRESDPYALAQRLSQSL